MVAKYGPGNYMINPINYKAKFNLLLIDRQKCSPGRYIYYIYVFIYFSFISYFTL